MLKSSHSMKKEKEKLSIPLFYSLLVIILFSSCSITDKFTSKDANEDEIPDIKKDEVARNCVEKGGELLVKRDSKGEKFVLCKFADGTVKEVKDLDED